MKEGRASTAERRAYAQLRNALQEILDHAVELELSGKDAGSLIYLVIEIGGKALRYPNRRTPT